MGIASPTHRNGHCFLKRNRIHRKQGQQRQCDQTAGSSQSAQIPEPEVVAAFTQFWQGLEIFSVPAMCSSLARLGVFTEPDECWDLSRIMAQCRVREAFSKLLGQWLDVLVVEGLLVKDSSGGFRNAAPFPAICLRIFGRRLKPMQLGTLRLKPCGHFLKIASASCCSRRGKPALWNCCSQRAGGTYCGVPVSI